MPNALPSETLSHYSPLTGLIYIFNLIVGTGALTLPAAFHDAGWLLSTVIIIILAFMSFLTATFVIESMACANAITNHRKIQRLKSRISVSQDKDSSSSDHDTEVDIVNPCSNDNYINQNDNEHEPLLSDMERVGELEIRRAPEVNSRRGSSDQLESNYYNIDQIFEMGKMAALFFNKPGRILFYLCLTIYLYGDLAIYGAAVAKSLRDVACTYTPANQSQSSTNISEYDPCWSNEAGNLNRMDAYRIALAVFVVFVGPFAFFNVTKTKYLQLLTTLMRWLAFGIMVTLACIRLSRGTIYTPPVSQFSGVPNLFGVCVYSFMCHHSLPSLVTPISRKKHITGLLSLDYGIILGFYFLLAFTGIFAFDEINDLYTLNFQPNPGEPWYMKVVHYFLSLFPVFTLSTNFPIIAITLRNNLKTLFLTEGRMYSWFTRHLIFPLLALVPPIAVAFVTNSLEFLVGITGSYAGAGIQYVVPALLVYFGRSASVNAIGVGVTNRHRSVFQSVIWVIFVNLWAVTCIVLVTWNHIAQAINPQ